MTGNITPMGLSTEGECWGTQECSYCVYSLRVPLLPCMFWKDGDVTTLRRKEGSCIEGEQKKDKHKRKKMRRNKEDRREK